MHVLQLYLKGRHGEIRTLITVQHSKTRPKGGTRSPIKESPVVPPPQNRNGAIIAPPSNLQTPRPPAINSPQRNNLGTQKAPQTIVQTIQTWKRNRKVPTPPPATRGGANAPPRIPPGFQNRRTVRHVQILQP